jgi:TRAP-type C4-dicarboxylate transport system substrate-binding protein
MPSPEVYENMEKGVIDGLTAPWDFVSALKFDEVTQSHLDNIAICGTMWFAMNQNKFDSLPDDVKAAIDELSGMPFIESLDAKYQAWEAAGRAAAEEAGHSVYALSDEDHAKWNALVEPIIEERLQEVEAMGVTDIREAYGALVDAIAAHGSQD